MNYKKVDYEAISLAIIEKSGDVESAAYLKQVDEGRLTSARVLEMIKDVAYDGEAIKEEFVEIDFTALAKDVSIKIGKARGSAYVKRVYNGKAKSKDVLEAARELLNG